MYSPKDPRSNIWFEEHSYCRRYSPPSSCRLGNLGKLQQGYGRALIFFELHKRVLPHKDDIHVHITGYLLGVALGCRANAIIYQNTRVYGDYQLIIAINASTRQLTVQPNATSNFHPHPSPESESSFRCTL